MAETGSVPDEDIIHGLIRLQNVIEELNTRLEAIDPESDMARDITPVLEGLVAKFKEFHDFLVLIGIDVPKFPL